MLALEIHDDGGITITGTRKALRDLAVWILNASLYGSADPVFVSDEGVTTIQIIRVDE